MTIHYPNPPLDPGSDNPGAIRRVLRSVAEVVSRMNQGKLNATTELTLTANAATSTFTDPRLTTQSVIGLTPLTANAAAEKGNGTLYVSARTNGSATITHANNAQTDRSFAVSILG